MTTTTSSASSAALVLAEPVFSDQEKLALTGFLAGYSGLTREAYALELRQFAAWCHNHGLRLFGVRRADMECFGRDLEAAGRAQATVTPGPGRTSSCRPVSAHMAVRLWPIDRPASRAESAIRDAGRGKLDMGGVALCDWSA